REREQLKDAFSRYVSTQVYKKLQQGEINLTGETRNATILFSDIRAFTALSERLPPNEVVLLLNEYFNVMVEIVFKHEGFLNKFMGDALMAVYNVPIDQTDPELRAVKTALEMMTALTELNRNRAERGLFAIKIGIGVNTGPVTAGNIGHMRRLEYTVIGDAVNLAQRIESQTKVTGMPILISKTTYQSVADRVVAQALPPVKVKGKQEPVALYAVTAMRDEAQPAAAAPAAPIPVPQAATSPTAPAAANSPTAQAAANSPAAQAAAQSPAAQAPTQSPAPQSPSQSPAAPTPPDSPAAQAPAQSPAAPAPAQSPAAQAPAQSPAAPTAIKEG
ncbi:MAG: adenylate/guanylate cyclase domain-containing protein, partial [Myxococcota bacterium]